MTKYHLTLYYFDRGGRIGMFELIFMQKSFLAGGGCQGKDNGKCVRHENSQQMGNVKKSRGKISTSVFLLFLLLHLVKF